MKRISFLCTLLLFAAAASAQHHKIDTKAFAQPKTIVLVDIPRMPAMAQIGVLSMYMPGKVQYQFTDRVDRFFEPPAKAPAPGDVASGTSTSRPASYAGQGLIGAMIMSNAEETQRRATGFDAEVLKLYPDFDLRASYMKALLEELDKRGIAVQLAEEGRQSQPRLRWPAVDRNGTTWPSGTADSSPAVDADLLVQICPVAFYNSPGPLNSYKRNVTVAIAVYDGRTKQFHGRQTVRFVAPNASFEYGSYNALVADLKQAAPALREALLALAVPVADLIHGKPLAD